LLCGIDRMEKREIFLEEQRKSDDHILS